MYIKKQFQGEIPENKIMNSYTESNTDAYTCEYINTENTYSTTEKATGCRWTDGRIIYKRTFVWTGSITGGTTVVSNTGITPANVIDMRGVLVQKEGHCLNAGYNTTGINLNSSKNIYLNPGSYTITKMTVTFWYVK